MQGKRQVGGKVFFVNKSLRNLRIVLSIPRRRRRTFVFFSLLLHRGEGGRKMDVGQEGGRGLGGINKGKWLFPLTLFPSRGRAREKESAYGAISHM